MFKFVKVYDNHVKEQRPEWVLVYDSKTRLSLADEALLKTNALVNLKRHSDKNYDPSFTAKMQKTIRTFHTDVYNNALERWPNDKLLIRENGTWMVLSETYIVTHETMSDTLVWPLDELGEIIICENDPYPEQWWVDKLTTEFPGKKIVTVTNFYARTVEEIQKFVDAADVVTFTTTFSRMDWFEKLCSALFATPSRKVLYFHCKDQTLWADEKIFEKYSFLITQHTLIILSI